MSITQQILTRARYLHLDLIGITAARPVPHWEHYQAWLEKGYHAQMDYLARPDRLARRADPTLILPGARSIVMVGMNYYPGTMPETKRTDPSRGIIAAYAWGKDYHEILLDRLELLAQFAHSRVDQLSYQAHVDTGTLLERAYATQAGLGFTGKNTTLINPRMGAWLFLGALLLDLELDPTPNHITSDCGACRQCLDACPTGALVAPYQLDARRCISYLTIELKGPIPRDLRPLIGNRIFGCDTCQLVCPYQRSARPTQEAAFRAQAIDRVAPRLLDLIALDERGFNLRYAGTAILRAKRRGLLRNVAVALGNWGDPQAIPALSEALHDPEPLIRGHAAWALGRIATPAARQALNMARRQEEDTYVQEEINQALER